MKQVNRSVHVNVIAVRRQIFENFIYPLRRREGTKLEEGHSFNSTIRYSPLGE